VADAEFVIDVALRVVRSAIANSLSKISLVHQLVNEPGALLLVGAHHCEAGRIDRRLDERGVDAVEIDDPPARVGLAPETA